jgi:hypothetical protein
VSSAKVAIVVLLVVGKSVVCSRCNNGPSTLPCGTPDFASLHLESALRYLTWKYLSEMYDFSSR